jgi:hypothetical protein
MIGGGPSWSAAANEEALVAGPAARWHSLHLRLNSWTCAILLL